MDTIFTVSGVSEVQRERDSNPSVIRVEQSLRLQLSCIYVDNNLWEILRAINTIVDPEKFIDLHTNQKQYIHMRLRDDISRLIFNYISSAFSLIDHSRKLYNKMFGADKMPEYQPKVDELNVKPVATFIKDLRNYVIHYRALDLKTTYQFSQDNFTIIIGLETDELLQWDNWTSEAKKYLELKGGFINVLHTLNEYQNVIAEFHLWFREEQRKVLAEDWKVYEEFDRKIMEDIANNCTRKFQKLRAKSEGFSILTFESELASVVPFGFWKEIDEKGGDAQKRFDNIFLTLHAFGLSEALLAESKKEIMPLIHDLNSNM